MEEIKKDNLEDKTEEIELDDEKLENQEKASNLEEVLEDLEFEELKGDGKDLKAKHKNLKKENHKLEKEIKSLKDDKEKLVKELSALKDDNSKLSNELGALKDRLLRINAEYDNFRKRTIKEKEGIYTDAVEDVLKQMLPVLDNLERAVVIEGSAEDIKKGIELTIRQFQNSMEKLGVEEIDTSSSFDPNLHEAVMHVQDEALGTNAVAEVFQKGYKRGAKVIRHSIVKVAN